MGTTDPILDDGPRVYRVPEAAGRLGVSERYVWQLITDGELREVRQGRKVGVRDDDLRDYINRHTSTRAVS